MVTYQGKSQGAVTKDGFYFSPKRSRQVYNHSPDGFNWGYGGSGPAQLALALLLDVLDDRDKAVLLYQRFKWGVVARWPMGQPWEITDAQIREWVDARYEIVREGVEDKP